MCCLCFRRVPQDDLNVRGSGRKEDVCLACAKEEAILWHSPYPSMKAYQKRVIAEKADLDEKHAKLIASSDEFNALPKEEQERLRRQSKAMDDYSVVLGERIAAFTNNQHEDATETAG